MKIFWRRHDTKHKIVYQAFAQEPKWAGDLNETHMDPIQDWCREHQCGQRISFDLFQFNTMEEVTMFMMKWS
jgi:hypothetical protein